MGRLAIDYRYGGYLYLLQERGNKRTHFAEEILVTRYAAVKLYDLGHRAKLQAFLAGLP